MKKTGNSWTDKKILQLINLWLSDTPINEIADYFQVSQKAINKQVTRMRAQGVNIPYRKNGHKNGVHNTYWTQSEVEYLVRQRLNGVKDEQISADLGRSYSSINAMITKLRKTGVNIPRLAEGGKRKWSPDAVRSAMIGRGFSEDIH